MIYVKYKNTVTNPTTFHYHSPPTAVQPPIHIGTYYPPIPYIDGYHLSAPLTTNFN